MAKSKEQVKHARKLNRARLEIADRYGYLYGLRLRDWFVFNGETAVPKGKDRDERKANLARFEERLALMKNASRVPG
jgi:hypothetical protein